MKMQNVDESLRLWDVMRAASNYRASLSNIMYISLFGVCAKKKNVDEGLRFLDEYERPALLPPTTR